MKAVHEAEVKKDLYAMAARAEAVRRVCEDLEAKIRSVESRGINLSTYNLNNLADYTSNSLRETIKTLVLKELHDNLKDGHDELIKLLGGNYNGE